MRVRTRETDYRTYSRNSHKKSLWNRKNRKRNLLWKLLLTAIGLVGIVILLTYTVQNQQNASKFSAKYVSADEIPGFLQFTYYSSEEWKEKLGSDFSGRLTYQNVSDLLNLLHIKKYVTYDEKKPGKEVTRKAWNDIYAQILDLLDTTGKVELEPVIVLKQTDNQDGSLLTSQKSEQFHYSAGIELESYQAYQMYVMGDEVLGVTEESKEETVVPNVFVTATGENLEFLYDMDQYSVSIETDDKIENTVCDLYFKSGKLTRIQKKEDLIEGKLLTLEDQKIEIDGYGVIDRTEDLPVYKTYGTIEEQSLSDIVLGNMNLSYVVADKTVCAILLKEPAEIQTIRVLLLNDDKSVYRSDVYISGESTFQISCGDVSESKDAGTMIKASDYLADKEDVSLSISGADGGKLYFCDETGAKQSCSYNGIFEIRRYAEGYAVVNALPMEQYLYGVIPSEMPSTYPAEALKAQAVCARSYAYIQMMNGDYANLGAHIDDSTNYQVYKKQQTDESTTIAVDDTLGQVISYQGQVVEAYYYSTSYGHSGDYSSWNLADDGNYDYLSGTWLKENAADIDLSDESQFASYITNADGDCYDSFAKYFRWKAELALPEKSDVVIEKINARKSAKSDNIIIHQNGASAEAESADKLGTVSSFAVAERSKSGGITKLTISFTGGSVDILDEYSIRIVLGTMLQKVTWNDGSEATDMTALPSSYFAVTSSGNGSFELSGGGYGHGIGMSQNGAKGMAEAGMSYEDILNRFYQNIELTDCYEQK